MKPNKKEMPGSADAVAVIVVSDTHINSTTAICPEVINLDDGGTYHPSRTQHMLKEYFDDFLKQALRLSRGYKRVVILNGDLGELDSKKRSAQLITTNRATVLRMMIDTLEPIVDIADVLIVMRGTPAHGGKASWLEEMFAADFEDYTLQSEEEVFSHYHLRMSFRGVKFDVAHHGRMGGLRHTQKVYAVRLAQETMDKYRDRGEDPPNVIIRSHNHRRADSGHNWPAFAMFTPAWQLQTEFAFRLGLENDFPSIGGDVFLCHPVKTVKGTGYFAAHKNFVWHPIEYPAEECQKMWAALKI